MFVKRRVKVSTVHRLPAGGQTSESLQDRQAGGSRLRPMHMRDVVRMSCVEQAPGRRQALGSSFLGGVLIRARLATELT